MIFQGLILPFALNILFGAVAAQEFQYYKKISGWQLYKYYGWPAFIGVHVFIAVLLAATSAGLLYCNWFAITHYIDPKYFSQH